jgi:hypothetical protein
MKKWVIIVLIILLIAVLVGLIYGYTIISKNKECIKIVNEYDIQLLRLSKCLSLCPYIHVNNEYDPDGSYIPDSSCEYYCSKKLDRNDVSISKCIKNKKFLEITKNFQDDLIQCLRNRTSDPDLFKSCINEKVIKYAYIEDLSNMQLEPYQIYNMTIENLDCKKSPPEVTVRLNEGTNGLKFIIFTNRIQNIISDSPNVGETKTLTLNESIYKDYFSGNLTEVEVTLSVNNYTLSIGDSKSC